VVETRARREHGDLGADAAMSAATPRVLHLTEGERFAGIEAHLTNLIPAQRAAGLDVHLATFALGPLSEAMRLTGPPPHLVERGWKYDPAAARRVRGLLADLAIDVLHTHGYLADVVGAAAARGRVPQVVTVHGLPEPFAGLAGWKMAANLALAGWVMRRSAARVVAVSGSVREHLLGRGVPGAKVVVLPSAVSPIGRDPEVRALVRAELAIPEGALAVGFVGRLEPVKRAPLLAEVAAELGAPLVVVVCGDGPERPALEDAVRRAGVADRFRVLGHRTDIERIVQGLDVLAIPSAHEGVPVSLLEAMSAGVVPVAFRVGGLPEAIEDGVSGVLVAPGDAPAMAGAIAALHADRARLDAMGRAAREAVETRFSPARLAEALGDLYESVIREFRNT
jgi:glycosyltransferase involved in cell wall biosynthesis